MVKCICWWWTLCLPELFVKVEYIDTKSSHDCFVLYSGRNGDDDDNNNDDANERDEDYDEFGGEQEEEGW